MTELNALATLGDAADDRRRIYGRPCTIGEHFELEKDALLALPEEAFDVFLELSCRVDTKSRVCVRQCRYSVPVRYAGRRLEVRLGAESVEVRDGARTVALHSRARGKGSEVLVLDHYLEVFKVKPGAFPAASALAHARSSGAFSRLHDEFYKEARRRLGDRDGIKAIVEVLLGHRTLPSDALVCGMERALAAGSVDPQIVLIEARKAIGSSSAEAIPIGDSLLRFDRPTPSLSHYDDLLEAT